MFHPNSKLLAKEQSLSEFLKYDGEIPTRIRIPQPSTLNLTEKLETQHYLSLSI